ncbi:glycosyltransferase family 2 protein [Rubrobacter aplysinae]|uniref:glycosyltransferase family 2 protein n=1 Tax=Rubrobacter aplysinae TaxID=909625 RepID=UPI00064BDE13|nr:glycosyltransferase family 2 protein [Rubrobacter aplysinae]
MSGVELPPLGPPEPSLKVSVVVPAKDEEDLIGRCIRSLAVQSGVKPEEYEVILVLDGCSDATADRALEAASGYPELRLALLEGPGLGAGHARRAGMEAACGRLISLGLPDALIASTDADTVVAPDWVCRQLRAAERGARAIGGRIELLDEDGLSDEVRSWRERRGEARHQDILGRRDDPGSDSRAEHWQFSGASMSLTAEAYQEVGGLEPRAALEDEQLESALERCNVPIQRPLDVRVSTSPRLVGRASRGLARDLSLASWLKNNTYPEPPENLVTGGRVTVSIIAPTHDETPGPLEMQDLRVLTGLTEFTDAEPTLIPVPVRGGGAPLTEELGLVMGRGDALWRGLSEADGELVVLLPDPHPGSLAAVPALLAPLLERRSLHMVKGYSPGAGSELSRLVGVPMINLHHPELAGFTEPLSHFVAARRPLLRSLPFPVGPGVDASLLLDAVSLHGIHATAQAAIPPQPDRSPAAVEESHAMISAFLSRVPGHTIPSPAPLIVPGVGTEGPEGFDVVRVQTAERPPMGNSDGSGRSERIKTYQSPDTAGSWV